MQNETIKYQFVDELQCYEQCSEPVKYINV